MAKSITLAITPGDPEGIGPEVTVKAIKQLQKDRDFSRVQFVLVGSPRPYKRLKTKTIPYCSTIEPERGTLPILDPGQPSGKLKKTFSLAGYQSGRSIELGVGLVRSGLANALVTGPISKERLIAGGFPYRGHTDFIAKLTRTKEVTMMLYNPSMKVALATTHVPLKKVSNTLNRSLIQRKIDQTLVSLRDLWKIKKPHLAVCGLNPHAGEGGHLGNEEKLSIEPAIRSIQKKWGRKARISGPHPADTLFATQLTAKGDEKADAILAMYHDQGLGPVKLLDFRNTVNITLGLPLIRTSVDHGTAFDIAGRGLADPSSMIAAIREAIQLVGD